MSQYLRGRGLPILLASGAMGGMYMTGRKEPNPDKKPMHISEKLETIGQTGGLPGKVNISERVRDVNTDPKNTKIISHTPDIASKRSSTKTRD